MSDWCAHLLDRCCFCWCSLIHRDGYYDEHDDCDENDITGSNTGTIIINLSSVVMESEHNNNNGNNEITQMRVDFDFESSSDSVQDDQYYDDYAINKYSGYIENDDKRIVHSCKMLENARNTVNTCTKEKNFDTQKMAVICLCYEQSIGTLGKQQSGLKRKIIKEYESVKNRVPNDCLKDNQSEIEALLMNARSVNRPIEERKKSYIGAIKLTVNIGVKKNLKKEYNQFLLLSGSINKCI